MSKSGFRSDLFFSSERDDWETPPEIFEPLNEEFQFTLDPCCYPYTAKCKKFFTKEDDGLSKDWSGERVFMNPPYGRRIGKWIEKAFEESQKGALVVCLIPSRTDTNYWHDFCMKAKEIRFLRGRVKFIQGKEQKQAAPFGSAVVIFDGR